MPIHLDRLCLCPYLTGSPLFGFVTPGTSCPSAGSAVPAPARARNTAQRSEIRKPGLFYSAENQQKNLTRLPGGTFTDLARVRAKQSPGRPPNRTSPSGGRSCGSLTPQRSGTALSGSEPDVGDVVVLAPLGSEVDDLVDPGVVQGSVVVRGPGLDDAVPGRTLKVRYSTTRWCGRGTWDRLSGRSSTRVPHPSPQCELSSARPSTPLHTWSRTDQASRRMPSRDRRCCRAPRWRPKPLHAAPCHPCSCRRRRAPR